VFSWSYRTEQKKLFKLPWNFGHSSKAQQFSIQNPAIYTFAYSQITPPSAEINNEWSYASVAPVRPHDECKDNFTPSFADIMTPVQPPVIDSSMWTQRY
jgi:hypothetical protein